MNKEEILDIVKNYVQKTCENEATGHDWWHIQRVYNNAIKINKEEKSNEFILSMIVFMHDLYDHKFYKGNPEEKLEETLKELKIYEYLTKDEIKNIIYSCINLGFSNNIIEKRELSLEGKIAQDADRLDAIGAIGIARTFAYGGKTGKPIYTLDNSDIPNKEYLPKGSNTSINHFYDKLLKLKDLMNTSTAKQLAIKRHKFMESYLEEFFDEWNGIR